jgi:type VI secretion system protein ImpA
MALFERLFGKNQNQTVEEPVRIIDIESLLRDITAEAPSGAEDLEYDPAFIALEKLAEGTPEKRVGDKIIEEGRAPSWKEVKSAALALLERTHDIRVAISLVRALLHADGLPGLRDGLALLAGMMERHWETLYPRLDPDDNNDPTQRVNILMSLCDREMVLLALLNTPLCASRTVGIFSLRDIHIAAGKITVPDADREKAANSATIRAAFQDCGPEKIRETAAAVADSLECVIRMEAMLTEKLGAAAAPHFGEIRQMLSDMNAAVGKHQEPADADAGKEPAPQTAASWLGARKRPAPSTSTTRGKQMEEITSRQDVINLLGLICSYYEQNEPASPVPLLLKRAMGLVEKDFLTIVEELAPESLSQIKLIGGIKDN